jgi:hypothetical protein
MQAIKPGLNARAEEIRRANELAARDPEQVLAVLTRNNAHPPGKWTALVSSFRIYRGG